MGGVVGFRYSTTTLPINCFWVVADQELEELQKLQRDVPRESKKQVSDRLMDATRQISSLQRTGEPGNSSGGTGASHHSGTTVESADAMDTQSAAAAARPRFKSRGPSS